MSNAACMAPTDSAVARTTASWNWCSTWGPASATDPTTWETGTRTSRIVTCEKRRVRSTVERGSTDTPGAPAGTRTWDSPSPVRPVTSRWVDWPADSTGRLTPSSTTSSPTTAIVNARSPGRTRGRGSAKHHEAMTEPSSSPESSSPWAPAPAPLTAAATTLVVDSGPGAAWRPNSWATTDRSSRPSPLIEPPPSSSATSNDVQPSSAPRRQ